MHRTGFTDFFIHHHIKPASPHSRPARARAQSTYEMQVYGSDTVAPRTTMVELHSNLTLEYYAGYGSIANIASFHDRRQQFFPAIDLNVSPDWEFNFAVGIRPTAATDRWIVKCIVGRRFSWRPKRK